MKPFPSKPIPYLYYYLKQFKWLTVLLLIMIAIACILIRLNPYFFSLLIDEMTNYSVDKKDVWKSTGIILLLIALAELASGLWRRCIVFVIQHIEPDMLARCKNDAMTYILTHSTSYLNGHQIGKITARTEQLSTNLQRLFLMLMWGIYMPILTLLTTLGFLIFVNWIFGALFAFWTGLLILAMTLSSLHTQKYAADRAEKSAVSTGYIADAISNHTLVRSFANLSFEEKKLHPLLKQERDSLYLMLQKFEVSRLIQLFIMVCFNVSTLVTAIILWQRNIISAGNIVLVMMLINGFSIVLHSFSRDILELYRATGTLQNALKIISTPFDIVDVPHAKKLHVKRGRIDFDKITFSYNVGKPIFKNFNLTIAAGERIGLVGVSGSGKSSLISLLQRLYDVSDGTIRIDAQNIAKVAQDSLHYNIGVIPQDTSLFHRSLMDNIRYGNPLATDKQVIRASKLAHAHDFITQTAHGYDSLVGDRGVRLSGGQRQRIAIARAILKNAPILILDEATSALDSESEKYIQESMARLMRGKTVIAIAHRLSTLKEMDRIIVMSKGKIIEQGSPAQLLQKKGKYAKLWQMQTEQKES